MAWTLLAPSLTHFPRGVAASATCQTTTEWFFFGGYDREGNFSNDLFVFHFVNATWRQLEIHAHVPRARSHAIMTVVDGMFVLYGGYSTEGAVGDLWRMVSVDSRSPLVVLGHECQWDEASSQIDKKRGAAASVVIGRKWFVFGGCGENKFFQDLLSISLENVTPVGSHVSQLQQLRASTSELVSLTPPRHPYHIIHAGTSSSVSPEKSPFVSQPMGAGEELKKSASPARMDAELTSAISSLKLELFGPRVRHVDTLVEENKKLRQENAKLQRTVLDLMKRLADAGI
jgi:hypothetical protein